MVELAELKTEFGERRRKGQGWSCQLRQLGKCWPHLLGENSGNWTREDLVNLM